MSTISIHQDTKSDEEPRYRAIAGGQQKVGATMGQALNALMAEWGNDVPETVILIQRFQPDAHFTEAQQRRKRELLSRRTDLTQEERAELESLLDAELDGTIARTNHFLP